MRVKSKDKAGAKRPDEKEGILFPASLLCDKNGSSWAHRPPASVDEWSPGQIWIVRNYLTKEECQAWINHASSNVKLEHVQQQGTRHMAARECHRAHGHDAVMALRLYERLLTCAPQLVESIAPHLSRSEEPVTLNPNVRLYRYETGMHFAKHYDDSNVVAGVGTTRLTALIYLNECQGGATRFYTTHTKNDNGIAFQPTVGAMLLHVHGDLCLAHCGDAVLGGTKWILRTDLVYK